jgi:aminoglycoside phosphotransferase (APT) family kinase protein
VLSGVTEAEALLAMLAAEESIDGDTAHKLLERIEELHATLGTLRSPIRPLHGDAHLNNVINTAAGPLWNDWEDTCLGPLGWDAACLKLTRDGGERAEAALAASGIRLDPAELALWVEARSLQVAVWRAYLATS